MKKFIFGLLLAVTSLSASAFDRWVDDKYKSGETVYSSGIAQVLLVGARGVGMAINEKALGYVVSKEVLMRIDDEPQQTIPIQHVGLTTYLIKGNETLVSKIASAKKVEIEYRVCRGTANSCAFTYAGILQEATWEFDTPLSSQFKDYQDKIR